MPLSCTIEKPSSAPEAESRLSPQEWREIWLGKLDTAMYKAAFPHHSGNGDKKTNIISELSNPKYIPHGIGSNPQDLLTPDKTIEAVGGYFRLLC